MIQQTDNQNLSNNTLQNLPETIHSPLANPTASTVNSTANNTLRNSSLQSTPSLDNHDITPISEEIEAEKKGSLANPMTKTAIAVAIMVACVIAFAFLPAIPGISIFAFTTLAILLTTGIIISGGGLGLILSKEPPEETEEKPEISIKKNSPAIRQNPKTLHEVRNQIKEKKKKIESLNENKHSQKARDDLLAEDGNQVL